MCENAQICDKWSFWEESTTGGHCYFFIAQAPPRRGYITYGGECTTNEKNVIVSKATETTTAPTSAPTEESTANKEVEHLRQTLQEASRKAEQQNAEQEMKGKIAQQKAEAVENIARAMDEKNQAEAAAATAAAEAKESKRQAAQVISRPCPTSARP